MNYERYLMMVPCLTVCPTAYANGSALLWVVGLAVLPKMFGQHHSAIHFFQHLHGGSAAPQLRGELRRSG
jgi:hypothetical protein